MRLPDGITDSMDVSLREDGGVSGVSSSCGARGGFLPTLKLMSIKSVMPSSHLILCRPFLLLPPIPPSIRVFSSESTLHIRWPYKHIYKCTTCISGISYTILKQKPKGLLFFNFVSMCVQSRLTLCDPMDCSPPGSSVYGIFQAKTLELGRQFSPRSLVPRLYGTRVLNPGRLNSILNPSEAYKLSSAPFSF